ncbi:hypothetical protein TI04_02320 [Achromatium sp. WMS2]|nr:hypothetical protein TI04_02320 [Achromatium sp. WMS2]
MSNRWIITSLFGIALGIVFSLGTELSMAADTNAVTPTPAIESQVTANAAITEEEMSSFGCIIGATSMITAAYWAGPSEAIMLWGGGLLTPSGSGVLAVSIIGGLGWAGCSLGYTLTPTLIWAYQSYKQNR